MSGVRDMLQLEVMSDLVASPVQHGAKAFLAGKLTPDDGLGGLYRWDANSSADVDQNYMNVIASTVSSTGRWIRVFQRARSLPHGTLVLNGGIRTFYANGTTGADGSVTLNLTMNNTATGDPIFTEVWHNTSRAKTIATTPSNAVQSYVMDDSSNLKVTKHGFYRSNVVTLSVGLLYTPCVMVPAGVSVQFRIEGI